ncbi:MAG: winged helix-turn-helix transcriptional regulator [Promethearchaeota archaeon]
MKRLYKYKELVEIMPAIHDASLKGLQRDFEDYDYDVIRMKKKFKLFSEFISTVQGKWTIEICYTLVIQGECSFNELKRALPDISTRTLTDRLRTLEKRHMVERRVETLKQIRVYYKLSEFGKQEIVFLVPMLLNFVLPRQYKRDYRKFKTLKDSLSSKKAEKEEKVIEIIK